MGYKRVGCYPCIMATQQDVYNISVQDEARIAYIAELEHSIGSSFFGPGKIPSRFCKKDYPLIGEVVEYVKQRQLTGTISDDYSQTSCMSFYGLCE